MFSSRKGHSAKFKKFAEEENPEALVFLYQLCYVSVHNEAKKLGLSEKDRDIALHLAVVERYESFRSGTDLEENYIENTSKRAIDLLSKKTTIELKDNSLLAYLEKESEPSIRENIWGKRWTIISFIIILLASLGLFLTDCNR